MLSNPFPCQRSLFNLAKGERLEAFMEFFTHTRKPAKVRATSASTTAIPAHFHSGKALTHGVSSRFSNSPTNGFPWKSDALNIMFPIGGIDSRFQTQGYRFPKPLINVVGRPVTAWIIEGLIFQTARHR